MPKVVNSDNARHEQVEAKAHAGKWSLRFAFITGVLFACINLALSGLSALGSVHMLMYMLRDGVFDSSIITFAVLDFCLSVCYILIAFLALKFYMGVYRGGLSRCFSDSKQMFAIAVCLLIIVFVKLLMPEVPTMHLFSGAVELESSGSSLDLVSLLMSGFFFVLSSVFQFGAAVQNDSDEML